VGGQAVATAVAVAVAQGVWSVLGRSAANGLQAFSFSRAVVALRRRILETGAGI